MTTRSNQYSISHKKTYLLKVKHILPKITHITPDNLRMYANISKYKKKNYGPTTNNYTTQPT